MDASIRVYAVVECGRMRLRRTSTYAKCFEAAHQRLEPRLTGLYTGYHRYCQRRLGGRPVRCDPARVSRGDHLGPQLEDVLNWCNICTSSLFGKWLCSGVSGNA
jgi:hypothetical protein